MRVAFGLAGLALSVVAIGACGEPHYKDADAVSCMAFLALQTTAVSDGRASGNVAELLAAGAAWRTLAEQKYTADELAQYFASSVAVFGDLETTELSRISTTCQAQAPTRAA
jgi:hypothetical protein